MPDTSTDQHELRDLAGLWWLTTLMGLLSVAAGAIVVIKPSNSLTTIAVVTGIFVAIDGVTVLLSSLRRDTQNRGMAALIGVLSLVAGVILIRHPIAGVTAVALLMGLWLITIGVVRVVLAFEERAHRFWRALVAAIEILAGTVIVASPGIGLATLALLIGITLIINGAVTVTLGMVLHGGVAHGTPTRHTPAAQM